MVMNQCLFEYSYGKPVGTAIKYSFSWRISWRILFCFILNECATGQPVGAGWTAYIVLSKTYHPKYFLFSPVKQSKLHI
jgi:hypothetical protein